MRGNGGEARAAGRRQEAETVDSQVEAQEGLTTE